LNILNGLSTLVIAIATVVATIATRRLANLELTRNVDSNGIYAWVTPDSFVISNGHQTAGGRWLRLNLRSVSDMPAYEVCVEVLLEKEFPEFPGLKKNQIVYTHQFPVLFENGQVMSPIQIEIDQITNSDLQAFLRKSNLEESNKSLYEQLATNMRAQITFRDINGVKWQRSTSGKLKRMKVS
jgi:hypothetical protein